jgi:transcriptional regulator of acetoin/glycerol metabolism
MVEEIMKIQSELNSIEVRIYKLKRSAKNAMQTSDDHVFKLLTSEKYRLETAIDMTGTLSEAATLLGLSERSIYRKIKQYEIKH